MHMDHSLFERNNGLSHSIDRPNVKIFLLTIISDYFAKVIGIVPFEEHPSGISIS